MHYLTVMLTKFAIDEEGNVRRWVYQILEYPWLKSRCSILYYLLLFKSFCSMVLPLLNLLVFRIIFPWFSTACSWDDTVPCLFLGYCNFLSRAFVHLRFLFLKLVGLFWYLKRVPSCEFLLEVSIISQINIHHLLW
jgi:hypothetical protein